MGNLDIAAAGHLITAQKKKPPRIASTRVETALWFLSRGDECLNCKGSFHGLAMEDEPLLIKVHKAN